MQFVAGLKPAAWEQAQAPRSTIELQAPTPQPRHAKQQTLMAIPEALKARQRGVHKAAVAAARYKQVGRALYADTCEIEAINVGQAWLLTESVIH